MQRRRQTAVQYCLSLEAPPVDALSGDFPSSLLARLRLENSALESLRLALVGNEERLLSVSA